MSLQLQEKNKDNKYKYYIWSKEGEQFEKSSKVNPDNKKTEKKEKKEEQDIEHFFDYRAFRKDLDIKKEENDKSICNDRLTGRDKIIQRSINPFLSNNNYLSDLSIQDEYLRPKNSSYGKI